MAKGAKRRRKGTSSGGNNASSPKPEDDAALWQAFAQNIDPLDLKGRVPDIESDLLDEMLRRESAKVDRMGGQPDHPAVVRKPGGLEGVRKATTEAKQVASQPVNSELNQLDDRQVRRIGSGRSGIDGRIDLHGMRQYEAHGALRVFLFRAVAKGHRMVLVITGKGSSARDASDDRSFGEFVNEGALGRGVLRRNVPLWLAEPDLRAIVVGYTTAHIKHGGEGALYVQLRRRR